MAFPWDNQNNMGQDQEKLRQNAGNATSGISGLFGGWNDFWASINRPVNYQAPSQEAVAGAQHPFNNNKMVDDLYKRNLAPEGTTSQTNPMGLSKSNLGLSDRPSSNSMQTIQALNTSRLPGLNTGGPGRQGNDDIPASLYRDGPPPLTEDQLRMKELQGLLDQDFQSSGESDAMVESAYAAALANIGKARSQANSNFQQSDKAIADLTAGHVNEINTKDRAAVTQTADNLQSDYKQTYGDARQQISSDRDAEISAKTDALKRLGIEEAGLGDAGQAQSEAITRLSQNEAGANQQADTYKAADLTRNTEQAQSQASAGLERRGALSRDLQKILGGIDDSEATVNNSKAMAKLQAMQGEKADFRQQQQFNLDSMNQLMQNQEDKANTAWDHAFAEKELAAKSNSNSSGGVFQAVGNDLAGRGMDPSPYLSAYSQAMQDPYNQNTDGDKTSYYVRKMKEKNPGLNQDEILRYVMGIQNYGTDKLQ